jgi:cytochrome c5
MRIKIMVASIFLGLVSVLCVARDAHHSNSAASPVVQDRSRASAMRLEGEKRFHANCGRCHAAPEKFPPRMTATIVRHMRVRATITDEDMRLVLYYLTQ